MLLNQCSHFAVLLYKYVLVLETTQNGYILFSNCNEILVNTSDFASNQVFFFNFINFFIRTGNNKYELLKVFNNITYFDEFKIRHF